MDNTKNGNGKVLGLAYFMERHSVQDNNRTLEEKTRRVLRSCHQAATRHASNFDSMLADLAAMKETNVEANDLCNTGLLLIDPTSKKTKVKQSLQKYEPTQAKNTHKKTPAKSR